MAGFAVAGQGGLGIQHQHLKAYAHQATFTTVQQLGCSVNQNWDRTRQWWVLEISTTDTDSVTSLPLRLNHFREPQHEWTMDKMVTGQGVFYPVITIQMLALTPPHPQIPQ